MFLEQLPVIISTLKLLKTWTIKQQQQQEAANGTPTSTITSSSSSDSSPSSSSSSSSDGRWLVVPRFFGSQTYTLYDPLTGQAVQPPSGAPLTRIASSYTAWRAAEIVEWYLQLDEGGQGAVQQLLLAVTASGSDGCHGSSSSSSTGDWDSQQGANGNNVAAAAAATADKQLRRLKAAAAAPGGVDAVAAFAEVVRLVGECGRIERRANKVVVWWPRATVLTSRL
jgi:hypothetical protein